MAWFCTNLSNQMEGFLILKFFKQVRSPGTSGPPCISKEILPINTFKSHQKALYNLTKVIQAI